MRPNTLKTGKHWRKGRIKWCGPTALALITGRTLMHCQRVLAKVKGTDQRYVRGVWNTDMKRALMAMGFDWETLEIEAKPVGKRGYWRKPTLRQYIEEQMPTRQWKGTVLFQTTRHYVVAHAGMVQDNHRSEPTPARDHPASRQRIEHAWLVKRRKRR